MKNAFKFIPLEERIVLDAALAAAIVHGVDPHAFDNAVNVYVDQNATGLGNGTSWANAYTTLQAALSADNNSAEIIHMAGGTYTPTAGGYILPNNIEIIGGQNGTGPTVFNPDGNSSIFNANGVVAVLENLTISNANNTDGNGGGIYSVNSSNLTLYGDTFSHDSASLSGGAVYSSDSILTVQDSSFTSNSATGVNVSDGNLGGDGGAIFTQSDSLDTIIGSSFSLNTANTTLRTTFSEKGYEGAGGAIYLLSGVSENLSKDTFTDNQATSRGGAVFSPGDLVYTGAASGSLAIADSTFTHNTAGLVGGGVATTNDASLTVQNTDFTSNSTDPSLFSGYSGSLNVGGGALWFASYNPTATGIYVTVTNSTFTDNSATSDNSSISENAGALGIGVYGVVSVVNNDTFRGNSVVDPLLAGGGAVEIYNSNGNATVNNDIFTGNSASTNSDAGGAAGGALYSVLGDITVNNDTFTGNSISVPFSTFIEGDQGGAVDIGYSNTVMIRNDTFINNSIIGLNGPNGLGGAIAEGQDQNATLTNDTFIGNSAANCGAIFNSDDINLTISNSLFMDNTASGLGGAIHLENDGAAGSIIETYLLTNNSFIDNKAGVGGGAIQATAYDLIYNTINSLTIKNNFFSGNTAGQGNAIGYSGGGAILAEWVANLEISNNIFAYNSATGYGGAILENFNGNAAISNNVFLGNSATESGGAISTGFGPSDKTLSITGNLFIKNTASYGGAIQVDGNNTDNLSITSNTFIGNYAFSPEGFAGGAIIAYSNQNATISGNTFALNTDLTGYSVVLANNTTINGTVIGTDPNVSADLVAANTALSSGGVLNAALGSQSATVYVSPTGAGNQSGSSWQNASTLQEAMAISPLLGSVHMYMEGGTYNIPYDFSLQNGFLSTLVIEGGFTGVGMNVDPNSNTIINNNASGSGQMLYLYGINTVTIDNITFENAYSPNGDGGALLIDSSGIASDAITLSNDTFLNNTGLTGGAVAIYGSNVSGSITLSNDTFTNNTGLIGGAVAIYGSNVSGSITLSNDTFTNNTSAYGGAVYLEGIFNNISISNSTFTHNSATGSDSQGGALAVDSGLSFTLSDSTFADNSVMGSNGQGGALFINKYFFGVLAPFTISNSTFDGNSASGGGGAIAVGGYGPLLSLTLSGSTFDNNSTSGNGGALWITSEFPPYAMSATISDSTFNGNSAGGEGGAIFSQSNNIVVTDSMFANNSAVAGGAIASVGDPSLQINLSTFTQNTAIIGGAIDAHQDLNAAIENNTFSGNNASSIFGYAGGAILAYSNGNVAISGNNFTSGTSNSDATGYAVVLGSNGTINGTISGTDSNIPADLAAANTALVSGQVYNAAMGSQSATLYVTPSGAGNENGASWQNAATLGLATQLLGTLSPMIGNVQILLESGTYNISSPLAMSGSGPSANVTIQGGYTGVGNNQTSSLAILNGGGITLSNIGSATLQNLELENGSGIVQSGGALNVVNDTFLSDTGGAISVSNMSSVTITGSTFTGDSGAAGFGGAVHIVGNGSLSTVTLSNDTFTNNTSRFAGGALQVINTNLVVNGCVFTGNSAGFNGGALDMVGDHSIAITNSQFSNNSVSSGNGGAIEMQVTFGNILLQNNVFQNNTSGGYDGGAVFAENSYNGTLSILDNTFTGNSAGNGGALRLFSNPDSALVQGNSFSNNSATNDGGAIQLDSNSAISITDNTFTGNNAQQGGAIAEVFVNPYGSTAVQLTITSNTFNSNAASGGQGPAIYLDGSEASVNGDATLANWINDLLTSNSNLLAEDIYLA